MYMSVFHFPRKTLNIKQFTQLFDFSSIQDVALQFILYKFHPICSLLCSGHRYKFAACVNEHPPVNFVCAQVLCVFDLFVAAGACYWHNDKHTQSPYRSSLYIYYNTYINKYTNIFSTGASKQKVSKIYVQFNLKLHQAFGA